MTLEQLADSLPGYAKDLKLNLSSVLRQTELTPGQLWGTAVSCALAARHPALLEALTAEASKNVSEQVLEGARIAGAIMAMNNVWYRFHHLTANEKFATTPARLRMNGLRTHGCEATEFELWCLAVSAINGCSKCVAAHENVLKEKGVGDEQIAAAVRIASVVQAVATVLATANVQAAQPVMA
jgi:lipoyl-dependent peroxiredoxin subunit D